MGRAGTIKGSLRYQAKVAVVMKRAKDNLDEHDVSSVARKKKREVKRIQAKSRLVDRLRSRSRKNLSRNNMVPTSNNVAKGNNRGLHINEPGNVLQGEVKVMEPSATTIESEEIGTVDPLKKQNS